MRDYIILTDTTADLPDEYIKEHHLGLLSLNYMIDGEAYDIQHELPYKEFYAKMRSGSMPTTAQVNPEIAKEVFSKYLDMNLDILYIAFSSGLSGSCSSAAIAAAELQEERPESKIFVIDSLCASLGEGLLVHQAVKQKKNGLSAEENAAWLEKNKLHVGHIFTVDDLNHLYRGGRVSKAAAVLGTMVNIKPVLHVNEEGRLVPLSKVRGRKKSLHAMVDKMAETMGNRDKENDIVFISHGDSLEDAKYLANAVRERFGIEKFLISHICPTIGAHSGPGTVALFFMCEKR